MRVSTSKEAASTLRETIDYQHTLIHKTPKTIWYLGVGLAQEVKDLYSEDCTFVRTEMKGVSQVWGGERVAIWIILDLWKRHGGIPTGSGTPPSTLPPLLRRHTNSFQIQIWESLSINKNNHWSHGFTRQGKKRRLSWEPCNCLSCGDGGCRRQARKRLRGTAHSP